MATRIHEISAEMRGDPGRVLDALVTALAASGFRVDRRTASEVELAGLAEFGSHHPPIVGASRIVARASGRRLVLTAELGGVERMRRLLLFIPVSVLGSVGLVFAIVLAFVQHGKRDERGWFFLVPLIPAFAVLLFVGLIVRPLASRRFEAKTKAALDALATSVATIGANG